MIPTYVQTREARKVTVMELGERMDYDASVSHRHDYFEVFIFCKGGGVHYIDFEPFDIRDHSVHIVAPGKAHRVDRVRDSNGYVLLFEASSIEHVPVMADFLFDHTCYGVQEFNPTYAFDKDGSRNICALAERLWIEYSSDFSFRNETVIHHLALLCLNCVRAQPVFEPVQSSANGMVYRNFRKMLYHHFREMKMVRDYSRELCVSEKQLNEIVRKQTGKSASSIIYGHLITEAKRLLHTGLSVKETGFELQFDDPAHFSKFFRTQTGMSPTDFRKIHV